MLLKKSIVILGGIFLVALYVFVWLSATTVDDAIDEIAVENDGSGEVRYFDRYGAEFSFQSVDSSLVSLLEEAKQNANFIDKVDTTFDLEIQSVIFSNLSRVANDYDYQGGVAILMEISSGEILSAVSLGEGTEVNKITNLYVPGSIVKPFVALGALSEQIIDPEKKILSLGKIQILDNNGIPLDFNDWKAHGYVDMRDAIGVSSNVYFYAIGGGYENQEGLGIEKINYYLDLFAIGRPAGIKNIHEKIGLIPNPKWKAENFFDDKWRLGDTYLTSIGQHGYQVSPLQMVRAVAGIANRGLLIEPTIIKNQTAVAVPEQLPIKNSHYQVVEEGMEKAVLAGTASGLYMEDFTVVAKTGTAEADVTKTKIHSWLIGYYPRHNPQYAFVFLLESGPWGEETGAVSVARDVFIWLRGNRPIE